MLETNKVQETSEKSDAVLDKIYLQLYEQKQELKSIIQLLTNHQFVTDTIRCEVIDRLNELLNQINTTYEENTANKDIKETLVEVKVEELIIDGVNEKVIKRENEFDDKNFISNITKITEISNVNEIPKSLKQKRKPKADILKQHKRVKEENQSSIFGIENDNEETNSGEVKFFCDQCSYSSSIFTNLKLHINNHHSSSQYPCDLCPYVACANNFLTRHKSRVHGGVRYYCELCEYNTTCMSNLKRHKESKHEGVKYTCDECNYSATLKQSLQRHINTKHKGIKFPCNLCSFTANHISDLNKHKKRMHKKDNDAQNIQVKCDECHFTAQNHANLKKHKKIKHNFTDL